MAKKTTQSNDVTAYRVPVVGGKPLINLANELSMSQKDFENAKSQKHANLLILDEKEMDQLQKEIATVKDLEKENAELKKQLEAVKKSEQKTDK